MTVTRLDISGPVSPFCLLTVRRKAKALKPSDELIITCDNIPAATTIIPQIARGEGMTVDSHRISSDLFQITLRRDSYIRKDQDP
jgi:TusA-related sulfurtransferase